MSAYPSAYAAHGFDNRRAYLQDLSDETGVPLDVVHTLADLLGPSEDFDGLVSALEDYEMFGD
jgi:hypothetical protein